jgi:dTDP-glucose 4,6-dehydratase
MEKVLVTGGAGFIGSNFVEYVQGKYDITVLDKLTYCGRRQNLDGLKHRFIEGDVNDVETMDDFDVVFHFAAETHVDNSVLSSDEFIKTNIHGTWNLLEALRRSRRVRQFIYISTDEVYGDVRKPKKSRETDPFKPSNPYSASKASADLLAQAYRRTYNLPIKIVRPSNCFGPKQYPEKIIPFFVQQVKQGLPMTIYSHGRQRRCWLRVEDVCRAIVLIVERGSLGEAYNVGGAEMTNMDIAKTIQATIGGVITHVEDRPGHDQRYCVNDKKIRKLGFKPKGDIMDSLVETISCIAEER